MRGIALSLLIFFSVSTSVLARTDQEYGHLFAGVGEILNPATFRVGTKNWEFGILNRRSVGLAVLHYMESGYAGIGPAVSVPVVSPGVFGAIGWNWKLFRVMQLRLELTVVGTIGNYSLAEVVVGPHFYW